VKLADLVDLEVHLVRDRDADPEALRARDRRVFRAAGVAAGAPRGDVLSAWLDGLRAEAGEPSLGDRVAGGARTALTVLFLLGVLVGISTGTLLLRFDGTRPVNVVEWVLVMVLLQVLLVLVVVGGAPLVARWPDLPDRIPLVVELRSALRWIVARLAGAADPETRTTLQRVRMRAGLYRGIERWGLLALTQTFAVAFNIGAIIAAAGLVVFTDLAFGWSTTLDLPAERFHALLEFAAAPFGWIAVDLSPPLELVAATRYNRLSDAYASPVDPVAAGRWWGFLVASVITYGFIPRAVLMVWAFARLSRDLRHVPLDTPDIDRIIRRLRTPHVESRGVELEAAVRRNEPTEAPPPSVDAVPSALIRWREAAGSPEVLRAAARTLDAGLAPAPDPDAPVHDAGNGDVAADRAMLAGLGRGGGRLIVFAEGWEAPDRGTRRFLGETRAAVGPRRGIVVALSGASAADVRVWREMLAELGDPYLEVEALPEATG
jgi:hypothetical protein